MSERANLAGMELGIDAANEMRGCHVGYVPTDCPHCLRPREAGHHGCYCEPDAQMNQKLEGRELVLYLMSRFDMTEEEAERRVAGATGVGGVGSYVRMCANLCIFEGEDDTDE